MTGKKRTLSICILAFAIFLFPHLEQALSEFFRVLRPGGMLAITVARDLDALSHWYGEHITEYSRRYSFPLYAGVGKEPTMQSFPSTSPRPVSSMYEHFMKRQILLIPMRSCGGTTYGRTVPAIRWSTWHLRY